MAHGSITNTALSDRYPVSKQPQWRPFRNMHHILHTYLHAREHDPHTPLYRSVRVCLRCYAELLLELALTSQGTSVTAFLLLGQVTLQEARSGPKTATRHPSK